jgi:amyloid beta precursor protein binding protein 1
MADTMVQTPPILHGPSEKERKYDRQLRLWAATGQSALESANILLVNSGCGTVGVETLKNLVLPGIGHFSIVDDTVVSDADLGVNFFLDQSSRGRSRAECCTELLLELNPDVQGHWYPKNNASLDLEKLLTESAPFTIILYTLPLASEKLQIIQNHSRQHAIPAIAIHSVGFYSYFSIGLPGVFPIVDTHPDETATTDLRLLEPWPQLSEFARGMTDDMDSLSAHDHGHLPMVTILLHYLDQWKQTHDGSLPTAYKDKIAFRELVSSGMRRDNSEGGEENFEEAIAAVMKHVVAPSLPSSLKQVFDYKHQESGQTRSSFWLIADAVKEFYDKHKRLPVPGGMPDMKAQSNVYIKLQNIYKNKAHQDATEILDNVRSKVGGEDIDPAEVELFAANARFIKLINLAGTSPSTLEQVAEKEFQNDEFMPQKSLLPIYLALTATSHAPTLSSEGIIASARDRIPAAADNSRVQQAAQEVARASGGELHNISAVMGGMVAQEVIKIITRQYIPVDNTCIFDGIESRSQVLRL